MSGQLETPWLNASKVSATLFDLTADHMSLSPSATVVWSGSVCNVSFPFGHNCLLTDLRTFVAESMI